VKTATNHTPLSVKEYALTAQCVALREKLKRRTLALKAISIGNRQIAADAVALSREELVAAIEVVADLAEAALNEPNP
jgi:hypothetical protein